MLHIIILLFILTLSPKTETHSFAEQADSNKPAVVFVADDDEKKEGYTFS